MASPPIQTGGGYNAALEAADIVKSQISAMTKHADDALAQARQVIDTLSNFIPIAPPPEGPAPHIDPRQFVVAAPRAAMPQVPAGLVGDIADPGDPGEVVPRFELLSSLEAAVQKELSDEQAKPPEFPDPGDLAEKLGGLTSDDVVPKPLTGVSEFLDKFLSGGTGGDEGEDGEETEEEKEEKAKLTLMAESLVAAPTLFNVEMPPPLDVMLPDVPTLDDVELPEFEFDEIEPFEDVQPSISNEADTSTALARNALADLDKYMSETPPYETEVLADVMSTVRAMLEGQTGLPIAVEQALYERAKTREDLAQRQVTQDAVDTWAGRGFDMPPGMLVAQVNAAMDQAALRTNAASRDISVEVARVAIENVRTAVAQGIAAEQVSYSIYDNGIRRMLAVAQATVEAEMSLLNGVIAIYNADIQAYRVKAEAYRTALDAAVAKAQVYRAQVDGAQAMVGLNESRTRTYLAQVQGVQLLIDKYRSELEAAKATSEVNRSQIDGYRAKIDAFRSLMDAKLTEYQIYEKTFKPLELEDAALGRRIDLFSSILRGGETRANLVRMQAQATSEAISAGIQEFVAKTQAQRELVRSQADIAEAKIRAYAADVERYSADLSAHTATNEAQIRSADVYQRTQISQYEISLRRYDMLMQSIIEQAKIQAESIRAAGQMATQLAAGAMSAMQVGATVRGGGDINYSESRGTNINYSTEF